MRYVIDEHHGVGFPRSEKTGHGQESQNMSGMSIHMYYVAGDFDTCIKSRHVVLILYCTCTASSVRPRACIMVLDSIGIQRPSIVKRIRTRVECPYTCDLTPGLKVGVL